MRAYKVLNGGRSPFTASRWPLPSDEGPGAWVEVDGPIGLCTNGVHAASTEQLPHWLGMELWELELDGEIVRDQAALVASRARLVRQVTAWDEPMRQQYARWCLTRAQEISESYPAGAGLVAKVSHTIWWGGAGPAGYFTAMLAGESATGLHRGTDYDIAFLAERALQADYLRRELGLADGP
ncbi:MAG TPA: hypothetical protein VME44_18490 [Streptosporangiaceae bacterium]|nr:hypothetical protein [Streptosporangiaceae bacterium]